MSLRRGRQHVRARSLSLDDDGRERILLREDDERPRPGRRSPGETRVAVSTTDGAVPSCPSAEEPHAARGVLLGDCLVYSRSRSLRTDANSPLRRWGALAEDKVIRVWDVDSGAGRVVGALTGAGEGSAGGVSDLSFLDGEHVVTSSPTSGVLLFDLRNGRHKVLSSRPARAVAVGRRDGAVFAVLRRSRRARPDQPRRPRAPKVFSCPRCVSVAWIPRRRSWPRAARKASCASDRPPAESPTSSSARWAAGNRVGVLARRPLAGVERRAPARPPLAGARRHPDAAPPAQPRGGPGHAPFLDEPACGQGPAVADRLEARAGPLPRLGEAAGRGGSSRPARGAFERPASPTAGRRPPRGPAGRDRREGSGLDRADDRAPRDGHDRAECPAIPGRGSQATDRGRARHVRVAIATCVEARAGGGMPGEAPAGGRRGPRPSCRRLGAEAVKASNRPGGESTAKERSLAFSLTRAYSSPSTQAAPGCPSFRPERGHVVLVGDFEPPGATAAPSLGLARPSGAEGLRAADPAAGTQAMGRERSASG